MKKTILALALLLSSCAVAPAFANDRMETISTLSSSVAKLKVDGGHCTVSKIGPRKFLTAAHCVSSWPNSEMKVEFSRPIEREAEEFMSRTYDFAKVTSVHVGGGLKKSRGAADDWAVLFTNEDIESMKPIKLGCNYKLKIGKAVATYGYPQYLERMYSEGYISALGAVDGAASAVWFHLPVSFGMSGGPIIDMKSKRQVAIVSEMAIRMQGLGVFASGGQGISVKDLCKTYGQTE